MAIQIMEKGKQLMLLKSIAFFSSLDDNDFDILLNHCAIMKYVEKRYIFREQTFGDSFYVILKGSVNVMKEDKKLGPQKLVTLSHGECFGEMAVLLDEPRTAGIVANEETFIFEIKLDEVRKAKGAVTEKLFYQFAVTLAKRLEWMTNQKVGNS